jgi:hypothetical protein
LTNTRGLVSREAIRTGSGLASNQGSVASTLASSVVSSTLGLVGRKTIGTASGSADVVLGDTASSSSAGSRSAAGGSGKNRLSDDRCLDTGRASNSQGGSRSNRDGLAVDSDHSGGRAVCNKVCCIDSGVCSACRSNQGQGSSSGDAGSSSRVGVCRVASIGGWRRTS